MHKTTAAATAETLSEEDCVALAYDMYDDVLSIAGEFYGFPFTIIYDVTGY